MTLTEVLLAATLLIVLGTLVAMTMNVITNVSTTVSAQYQEYDQAVPALGPLQNLFRAEVEPAPTNSNGSGAPQPGFAQYTNGANTTPLDYGVQFYSNVGTTYSNFNSDGNTAGPAKIVAVEIDQSGNPVTASSSCSPSNPCSFQVRRYLPTPSTCPSATASTGWCSYPSSYVVITNVPNVVNGPGSSMPIFTYNLFDPQWTTSGTNILVTDTWAKNNQMTGLNAAPYNYPSSTQTLTACQPKSASYPTPGIACPLDAVQSVGIFLRIQRPGSGPNGTVDVQSIVYRYPPLVPNSLIYPYQWPTGAAA